MDRFRGSATQGPRMAKSIDLAPSHPGWRCSRLTSMCRALLESSLTGLNLQFARGDVAPRALRGAQSVCSDFARCRK